MTRACRFWDRVSDGTKDECWPWLAAKHPFGHGLCWFDGKLRYTHRIAYSLAHGEPGTGIVRHSCDNPSCCNPAHLELGTKADNTNDMVRRGRVAVNEALPQTKLSQSDVRAIRASSETHSALARRYSVAPSHIWNIRTGRSRRYV